MKMSRFVSVLVLVLTMFLIGCDQTTTTDTGLDYDYFYSQHIFDKYVQLNMSDDPYYIYYYGPECIHCNEIKAEVLAKFAVLENDQVFFVLTTSTSDIFDQIPVTTTPTLVYVVNHQVSEVYEGSTQVLTQVAILT